MDGFCQIWGPEECYPQMLKCIARWWFQFFLMFTPTWGEDPIWLIFFKWAETTNEIVMISNAMEFGKKQLPHSFEIEQEATELLAEKEIYPPWNLQQKPLKNAGWKTSFLLGPGLFSGAILVLGRVFANVEDYVVVPSCKKYLDNLAQIFLTWLFWWVGEWNAYWNW